MKLDDEWEVDSLQRQESNMAEEKITTETTEVRVEQHGSGDAKATVKKNGKGGSATAPNIQGAVDRAAELSKK
jgi:hypothetical protein